MCHISKINTIGLLCRSRPGEGLSKTLDSLIADHPYHRHRRQSIRGPTPGSRIRNPTAQVAPFDESLILGFVVRAPVPDDHERTAKKPASEFNAFPSSLLDEVRQFLERRGMSHGPAVGTAVPVPWPRVLSEGEATPRFVIRGSDLRSGFYIKLEQRRRPHDCRMSVIGAGFPGVCLFDPSLYLLLEIFLGRMNGLAAGRNHSLMDRFSSTFQIRWAFLSFTLAAVFHRKHVFPAFDARRGTQKKVDYIIVRVLLKGTLRIYNGIRPIVDSPIPIKSGMYGSLDRKLRASGRAARGIMTIQKSRSKVRLV